MRNRKVEKRNCLICGNEFLARVDHLKVGKEKYCLKCCHMPGGISMQKTYPILPASNLPLAHKPRKVVENNLVKSPCSICGDLKSKAHHDDYAKPLDVIWLCRKHHINRHRNY